jgi:preprotein translocase subunit SecD
MLHFTKWKALLTLATCLIAVAFALPNILTREQAEALPSWLPHRQINLGLDLQGGSHLLMEVDTASVVREHLEALVDSIRDELRKARIRYQDLGVVESAVTVRIPEATQVQQAREILRKIDPDAIFQETTDGQFRLSLSEEALRQRKSAAVEQSLEIVRRRVDETGVREPSIQRQGGDRVLVQLPGVDDPQRIKALIGKTAKMTFHLLDDRANISEALAGRPPPGSMVLPLLDRHAPGQQRRVVVNRRVVVSGENLIDAQPTFQNGEPVVSFRFDTAGGRRFGEATSQNVGKQLAIVLDDQVISAPQIREPILGGSGVITGGFSVAEAQDLALLLRAGALPAPLKVLEERTVGPGLGSDSIRSGVLAGIVGTIGVILFMIIAYGTFGLIANFALAVNGIILVAAMSALQATLTLPGIAGIVLTIGMAVDANVLIFEHIREEVRTGRTPVAAIDSGFTRALTTIIDSNLTTLFAAGFLYVFGSGPVRGFAVTLGIGIIASMFTAVTLTRLIVVAWLRRYRPRALAI